MLITINENEEIVVVVVKVEVAGRCCLELSAPKLVCVVCLLVFSGGYGFGFGGD